MADALSQDGRSPYPNTSLLPLVRGYLWALLLVVVLHTLAWQWTKREPEETPVIVPPMVDVELIAPPRAEPEAPAPPKAEPPAPSKPEPKPTPKRKPKPQPTTKPIETERPKQPPRPEKPAEVEESARPAPKPAPSLPPAESSAASSATNSSRGVTRSPAGTGSSAGAGQKISPAHDAAYLHNPKPRYPALAIARSWEGMVKLRVYVLPTGAAGQVLLQQSSGHDALDQAALEVVQRWRFVPAKRGEQAIASWVQVPLVFKLDSAR